MTSFNISEILAWVTVFLLITAIPLTLIYYKYLNKINSDSLLSKLKSTPSQQQAATIDPNFDFDNNWTGEMENSDYIVKAGTEKKLAKIILKTIALNGEMGMLIKQISDILELHEIEINYSITYLADKGFIESVNSQKGIIHYLTHQAKAYCAKKGYLAKVA